jgi:hypothetical protein
LSDEARSRYDFDPRFEACVLFYCASDEKFWRKVGRELEPDCLELPEAKPILEARRQLAKEEVPSSCLGVVQRCRAQVTAGKLDAAVPSAVDDVFERVLELSPAPPPATAVLGELLPLLKRRLQSKAIQQGHAEWAARGTFGAVRETLARAERLGRGEEQPGVRVGAQGFSAISEVGALERLPTGVFELDQKVQGLWRGALGLWVARSGGGKSMALVQQAATSIMQMRRFTGFITLELPQSLQLARLYAHMTGVPVNLILDNEAQRAEAQRRIAVIEQQIGLCEVAEFPMHGTSPVDVEAWIEAKEQEHGMKMECLVIDYADLLYTQMPGKEVSDYLMMRYVYAQLQAIAKKRNMWIWTASQASRGSKADAKPNAYLGLENVADSMNKARIADLVLTLNMREEQQIEIYVAKHRLGRADYAIGPLQTEFELARLTPWARADVFNWGVT